MDTGDVLILGGAGVGAYFLWRAYQQAQATAPGTGGGDALSTMNDGAARTTALSSKSGLWRGLLAAITPKMILPSNLPSPTAPGSSVLGTSNPLLRSVLVAARAPATVAPSPNENRYSSVNIFGVQGTLPLATPPRPGDPSPYQTRGLLW